VLGDARMQLGGNQLRRTHTGLTVISVSRPFLEQHVRHRVRALPGVRFAPPSDIVGLSATPDAHRVAGAKILRRADGSAEETVDADLVIDATGRGSRTPVAGSARLRASARRPGINRPRLHHTPVSTQTGRSRWRPGDPARTDPVGSARQRARQAGRRRVATDAVRDEG
jgi:2-polyprenyl-6-methoxyphenol hydroxylase-like FAD-dependent oxidoreductase